jgi:hypothetical protein
VLHRVLVIVRPPIPLLLLNEVVEVRAACASTSPLSKFPFHSPLLSHATPSLPSYYEYPAALDYLILVILCILAPFLALLTLEGHPALGLSLLALLLAAIVWLNQEPEQILPVPPPQPHLMHLPLHLAVHPQLPRRRN